MDKDTNSSNHLAEYKFCAVLQEYSAFPYRPKRPEKVSDDPADATNNVTEQMIGLMFKIRAKTMRGFKTEHKVLAHQHLSSFLRGEGGICDLGKVI